MEERIKTNYDHPSSLDNELLVEHLHKLINGEYQLVELKLCPFMTQVDNTQDGYIVVPDGSGAVINFNNGKTSTVSGTYYGKEIHPIHRRRLGNAQVRLPLQWRNFVP